ncbi:ATP-binding protein [Mycobacterium uberis]|uniref:ATP-binding protein n=1 Tax=Mycobacterium uberis TaxID=2162698 RepID=UPI00269C998B
MLSNLVANALQHSSEDAGVAVRVGTDGNDSVGEVADKSPGISLEDALWIFKLFYSI